VKRASALCAVLLACVLGAPAASAAEPNHQLLGAISGERIGPFEQFKDACGVAVDSKGDIYVADYYQNRVVVFNAKWEYVTQIDGIDPLDAGGVAPIDGPCDLAVDSTGNLYVDDYHRDVVRFAPSAYPPVKGTTYTATGTIDANESTGVTVDSKTDDLYVDDRTYVARYEAPVSAGEPPVAEIGQGTLTDSYSVAISRFAGTEGHLYVADAASETVKVYDPALDLDNPQSEIRGEGTQEGRFYLTDTDLAVDPADGHLYVANNLEPHFEEQPEAVVDEFSAAGLYRGSVPDSFLNGTPSFLQDGEPTALAIAKGDLYVTSGNYEDANVFVFGPPAAATTKFLTVSLAGTGEGSVTSIPAGISCEPVCEAEVKEGTTVVLKATPAPGSAIAGWSGCEEEPSPNRCAVTMGSDRAVTVEFEPAPFALAGPAAAATVSTTSARGTAASRRGGAGHSEGRTISQKGHLRVAIDGRLAPTRLPRTGVAPVAVSLAGEISTTDGSALPQLKKLRIEFNRGGRLEDRGLPVCPLTQINIASTDRALSACREALVGSGDFRANIVLSGQAPYPTTGRLLLFNGRKGGKPVLYGHIYASKPFATSFVITFEIAHRAHGRFGTVLTASLPEALGNWGYVTAIEMRLFRRYAVDGERRSYLSAGCPAPEGFPGAIFTLARTSFGFADGATLTSALTRSCQVR
jgi:DNA-binding beta-propeller fold protein YncE